MVLEAIADSSAILAYFAQELGGHVLLQTGSPRDCSVNYAEILGRLADWGLDDIAIAAAVRSLTDRIDGFDESRASTRARLRRRSYARRLSLGDRACVYLAIHAGLPVLTADRG